MERVQRVLAILVWVGGLATATAPSKSTLAGDVRYLTLKEAAQLALAENADIAALHAQADAMSLRAWQALAPNNPVLTVAKNDASALSPLSASAAQVYSLSFTLGFPGKALSQSAAARHQAASIGEDARGKELEILASLRGTFASLAANRKIRDFTVDEERRSQELIRLIEKRYASGQAAQVDLLNARVTLAGIQHDLLVNANEHEALFTQFLSLIRQPGAAGLAPAVPEEVEVPELHATLESLTAFMLAVRPGLGSTREQVEAARATLTNAWLQPLPDFQLAASMNNYDTTIATPPLNGVARDYSMSVGVAIPLFFPFNELTGIRAAGRDLAAAEARHESQQLSARAELQAAYTAYQAARKDIENLTHLVVPAAKSSYDLTVLAYSLGRANYFVLNEARKTWVQTEIDLITRKLAAAQLYQQIVVAVGCDAGDEKGPHACRSA